MLIYDLWTTELIMCIAEQIIKMKVPDNMRSGRSLLDGIQPVTIAVDNDAGGKYPSIHGGVWLFKILGNNHRTLDLRSWAVYLEKLVIKITY
ncbi:hypothetical protein RCL_jg9848.t1 [Rhizophagus clarus]|uniref:Uncharacterized protein n=1 Tax=Rhizophagus clarus TaxID=94130 RepID=A0A8H3LV93_9GLOM|nr:hypothetical protein RCL_jg9848.t1 [Rhizophagus clarus]